MPTAHSHRACSTVLLLLLAVLSFECRANSAVQLVLCVLPTPSGMCGWALGSGAGAVCVADSVWHAAGHLARVCMPTAHLHRTCSTVLLAWLSCRCADLADDRRSRVRQ